MEAQLTVEEGPRRGEVHVIDHGAPVTAGRGLDGLLQMGGRLAERHLELRLEDDGLWLTAVAGAPPALLEGQPIPADAPVRARPGDVLELAGARLRVDVLGDDPQATRQQLVTRRLGADAIPKDRFDVQGVIGQGSFGKVYGATRLADGRRVAIKVLRDPDPTATIRRRLLREVKTLSRLHHPNVVELLESHLEHTPPMLVLELIEGPSAADLVARGALPLADALRIGEGTARALVAAAAAEVLHRDVKPGNILIGPDGEARLADFGLAKDLEGTIGSLTGTGQGLGSVAYMAPEQLRDSKRAGLPADVYGLGATLYDLINGCPPFLPRSPADLTQIFLQDPPDLCEQRPGCPPAVRDLVHAMLAKEPERRPAIGEVLARITRLRAELGEG